MAGGERLLDELTADAAGGGDDGEFRAHAGCPVFRSPYDMISIIFGFENGTI
jgi:hypothetical protein